MYSKKRRYRRSRGFTKIGKNRTGKRGAVSRGARKRYFRRTGKISKSFRSKVQRTLFKTAEWKWREWNAPDVISLRNDVQQYYRVLILGPNNAQNIPLGPNKNERIGSSIWVSKIIFKYNVEFSPIFPEQGLNNIGPYKFGSIFYKPQPNQVATLVGQGGDPIANAEFISPTQFINREKCKILRLDWLQSDTAYGLIGSQPQNVFGYHCVILNINQKWDFQLTGNQLPDDYIWWRIVAPNLDNNLQFRITYTYRIYYKDI